MLRISKAFAPILERHGGGAFLNVLSVASWVNGGELAAYSASKSAAWSLTNALRNELAAQKTHVLALHMGYVDTDLTRGFDIPKASPEAIVKRALDGLESGLDEVLADELTVQVKRGLTRRGPATYPSKPEPSVAAEQHAHPIHRSAWTPSADHRDDRTRVMSPGGRIRTPVAMPPSVPQRQRHRR